MEVHFTPEMEKQRTSPRSADEARTSLSQDAVAGYFDELLQTREMLNSRYDDPKGGRAKPIDGQEFFEMLRRREDELLKKHSPQ